MKKILLVMSLILLTGCMDTINDSAKVKRVRNAGDGYYIITLENCDRRIGRNSLDVITKTRYSVGDIVKLEKK